jgi:hypothetical protein
MLRAVLALLLATPVVAQRTWTVDGDARPGADFTAIQPAIDAARPGDTVQVRQALLPYAPFSTSKGLRILAEPDTLLAAPRFTPLIVATDLPADQTVVIDGFRGEDEDPLQTELRDNHGLVVLSRLRGLVPCNCGPGVSLPPGFSITDCAAVAIDACENFGKPALLAVRSQVTVTRSRLGISSLGVGLGDSLRVDGGRVDVTLSVLDGSMGADAAGQPAPAVTLAAGALRLVGTAAAFVQGSTTTGTQTGAPAIRVDGGHLLLDPDVQLNPQGGPASPVLWVGGSFAQRELGAALIRDARAGGTFDAALLSVPGAPAVLAFDLPSVPTAVPGLGDAWIGAGTLAVLVAGITPQSGELRFQVALPTNVLPAGLPLCVQGATDLGAGAELSTPAVALLR